MTQSIDQAKTAGMRLPTPQPSTAQKGKSTNGKPILVRDTTIQTNKSIDRSSTKSTQQRLLLQSVDSMEISFLKRLFFQVMTLFILGIFISGLM